MTDQSIPADKVQEVIDMLSEDDAVIRSRLEALLPAPRTLADELREYGDSLAGGSVNDVERQLILFADRVETLENELKSRDETSALPDGWRLADHPDHGRVIVTNTTPNRYGHVCFTHHTDALSAGYKWNLCDPAALTFLDTPTSTGDTHD